MSLDNIKHQLVTIFALKQNNDSILSLVFGMVILVLIDKFINVLPLFWILISDYFSKKLNEQIEETTKNIIHIPNINRILFSKKYSQENNKIDLTDAILNAICQIDLARDIIYTNMYSINNKKLIEFEENIFFKLLNKKLHNKTRNLEYIEFEIHSKVYSLTYLKKFVNRIYNDFEKERRNKFGDTRFYLNELIIDRPSGSPVPQILSFSMNEFYTNKNLDNMYGNHMDIVKKRVELFVNNKKWYRQRGIPHTLGILLYGPPGTGKTSLIKAIANFTHRHVINIKLQEETSQNALSNLFYNENILVKKDNQLENIFISLSERIYVIEDIDCLTDIVKNRRRLIEIEDDKEDEEKINKSIYKKRKKKTEINLSFLLNLLDGILETPGRILFITTNNPELLDEALIRPGRIDINLNLGYCSIDMIEEMFCEFFEINNNDKYVFTGKIKDITPAKVQEILSINFINPDNAYKSLSEYFET